PVLSLVSGHMAIEGGVRRAVPGDDRHRGGASGRQGRAHRLVRVDEISVGGRVARVHGADARNDQGSRSMSDAILAHVDLAYRLARWRVRNDGDAEAIVVE